MIASSIKAEVVKSNARSAGDTGSPEENEANAMAGVIMRHFNKRYPEYLSIKPIISNQ